MEQEQGGNGSPSVGPPPGAGTDQIDWQDFTLSWTWVDTSEPNGYVIVIIAKDSGQGKGNVLRPWAYPKALLERTPRYLAMAKEYVMPSPTDNPAGFPFVFRKPRIAADRYILFANRYAVWFAERISAEDFVTFVHVYVEDVPEQLHELVANNPRETPAPATFAGLSQLTIRDFPSKLHAELELVGNEPLRDHLRRELVNGEKRGTRPFWYTYQQNAYFARVSRICMPIFHQGKKQGMCSWQETVQQLGVDCKVYRPRQPRSHMVATIVDSPEVGSDRVVVSHGVGRLLPHTNDGETGSVSMRSTTYVVVGAVGGGGDGAG